MRMPSSVLSTNTAHTGAMCGCTAARGRPTRLEVTVATCAGAVSRPCVRGRLTEVRMQADLGHEMLNST